MHFLKHVAFFTILSSLFGCGYQAQMELPLVQVDEILGDIDGKITQAINEQCMTNQLISLKQGEFVLSGTVSDEKSDTIGYRFDNDTNTHKKPLLPNEQRKTIEVTLSLINKTTNTTYFGPKKFTASLDYDFLDGRVYDELIFTDAKGATQKIQTYSMGQLTERFQSERNITNPLYQELGQKVAEEIVLIFQDDDNDKKSQ